MIGCGSETSGTLKLSAPTSNGGVVTATAQYTSGAGLALPGQEINFRWYTVGDTTKVKTAEVAVVAHTDSTGIASAQYTLPATRTESLNVYVIASTGEITDIQGWQSVLVLP
jgi:hypothetical protein